MAMWIRRSILLVSFLCFTTLGLSQQKFAGQIRGQITDQTGAVVPGVAVELRSSGGTSLTTLTDGAGKYLFAGLAPGLYKLSISSVNFATIHRDVPVEDEVVRVDGVLRVAFTSTVTVTDKATFFNLADIENPSEDLVGVAESASQGAI